MAEPSRPFHHSSDNSSDFHDRVPSECDPLLPSSSPPDAKYTTAKWQVQSRRGIIAVVFLIIILLAFGGKLMVVPCTRIYEFILCHYYYNKLEGEAHIGFDEPLPEGMCKGAEVQEDLNLLMAVLWMIGCIPGLATTVAYGSWADRAGRRIVFALAMGGMVLAGLFNIVVMAAWKIVPLQLIWISPVFFFLGGGEPVANMMFYAMANDIVPEEERSTIFLLGNAGTVFADMLAPTVSSFLMLKSPWIPLLLGMGIMAVGTTFIALIPETLHYGKAKSNALATQPTIERVEGPKCDNSNLIALSRSWAANMWNRLHNSTEMLHSLPKILLLITFIVGPFGRVGGDMLLRYVSNRFHWDLRDVGFLLSLQGFFNLLLIVLILPSTSYILTRFLAYSNLVKDLRLAQFSAFALTIGCFILAIAPTVALGIVGLAIWTLGTGFPPIVRSLITTQVDPEHVGRLFAVIALIELLCYMGAGPLLAALYHLGLQRRGTWEGLPYFALSTVCGIALACVCVFSWLQKKDGDGEPGDVGIDNSA